MLETIIRPAYQRYFADPLIKRFVLVTKIKPNHITSASLLTGIVAASFIAINSPVFAIVFLILSGCLDSLDGTLARMKMTTSAFGSVLDIMSDRIVELAIVIGFYLQATEARALPCLLMMSSICLCVTSFLVVGIFSENKSEKSFHYSPGMIERFEAFVFFSAIIFLPEYFNVLAYWFSILVMATAAIRIYEFSKQS